MLELLSAMYWTRAEERSSASGILIIKVYILRVAELLRCCSQKQLGAVELVIAMII